MLDRSSFTPDDRQAKNEPTPFRYKRERQKLVVRTKKGETLYGTCFALNRKAPGFHLDLQGKLGESLDRTIHLDFEEVKAIFLVKSFDGHFDPADYSDHIIPETRPIAVKFLDGEVLIGRPAHTHWEEEARFYVVPEEKDNNNLMVLVERTAVKSVYDAKAYLRKQHDEYQAYKEQHSNPDLSEEECRGDFYYSRNDYKDALSHYRVVRETEPDNARVSKKLFVTMYNLGIHHIKLHDYTKALRCMEQALKINPNHPQAFEKAEQLRRHIEKHRKE